MDLAQVLRSSPAFESFQESELVPLERAMEIREHRDGDVLIREGERGDTFFLLVEGRVRVTREREEGGAAELGLMGPGEIFGLLALIDDEPRSATCTAAGDLTVACLPRSAFQLLYRGDSQWAYRFQHLVARQLVRDARSLNGVLVSAMLAADEEDSPAATRSLSYDFRLSMKE